MSVHDHVEPGDPRYAGFRIREIWMLCAVTPDDDQEALVIVPLADAMRHSLTAGAALASDERRLFHLREYARELARDGFPTRMLHLVLVDDEAFA